MNIRRRLKRKSQETGVVVIYEPFGQGVWTLERWVVSEETDEYGATLYDYDASVTLPQTWFCAARIETVGR